MNGVSLQTVLALVPEMILMGAAVVVFIAGAFVGARRIWSWVGGLAIVAAAIVLLRSEAATSGFSGPLVRDALTTQIRWLTLALGVLFLLATGRRAAGELAGEFVGSLLLILSGMMIVAGAGDLVLMFLGLELVSIPTYVLLYIGRQNRDSQESAVKYFYLSIVSSAILLYGFSFLFGISGSTSLAEIHKALVNVGLTPEGGPPAWFSLGGLAMILIFAGFAFKIAAVPFHFYAPDVYQGTTHANAAILAVAPKVVGIVGLIRIAVLAMPHFGFTYGMQVAMILAVLTMTVGNVLALWQDNLRRLLAYSSVAHAGYMLVGIAIAFHDSDQGSGVSIGGMGPVLFYLAVYSLATLGAFSCLGAASDDKHPLETTHQAAGLARRHPLVAGLLAIFLLTLAGIPPAMAGFWGKFSIFYDAMKLAKSASGNMFLILAIAGMLNAVIAAAYYLRVAAALYFRPADRPEPAQGEPGSFAAAIVACVAVLAIGFVPSLLSQSAADAARGAANSYLTAPASETVPAAMTNPPGDSPLAAPQPRLDAPAIPQQAQAEGVPVVFSAVPPQ